MRSLSESKLKKLSNTSMFILVRTLSLHDPNSNYLGLELGTGQKLTVTRHDTVKGSSDQSHLIFKINVGR